MRVTQGERRREGSKAYEHTGQRGREADAQGRRRRTRQEKELGKETREEEGRGKRRRGEEKEADREAVEGMEVEVVVHLEKVEEDERRGGRSHWCVFVLHAQTRSCSRAIRVLPVFEQETPAERRARHAGAERAKRCRSHT